MINDSANKRLDSLLKFEQLTQDIMKAEDMPEYKKLKADIEKSPFSTKWKDRDDQLKKSRAELDVKLIKKC